jgi:hypothetical protein
MVRLFAVGKYLRLGLVFVYVSSPSCDLGQHLTPPRFIAVLIGRKSLEFLTIEFTVYLEDVGVVDLQDRVKQETLDLIRDQTAVKGLRGLKMALDEILCLL